jgi:hypothetical protein
MARTRVTSSVAARRWTAEQDAVLTRLLKEGKDLTAISARMKRTIASLERRARDLRAQAAFRSDQPKSER